MNGRTVLAVDGELLRLLGEVGSTDKADDGNLANLLQEVEHLLRRLLWRAATSVSACD